MERPSGGDLAVSYDVNDLVHTLQQGSGVASTYTLDVDGQRVRGWSDGAGSHVNHYRGGSDSPVWIAEGGGYARVVAGLGGLVAICDSVADVVWQVVDLHGDVVATTGDGSGLDSVSQTDEFGDLDDSGDVGTVRYGWLGGKQRAADNPDGIILMGVRLYNPATGRFLSVDPVEGGSCNRYDYVCQNPLNQVDLDGRHHCRLHFFCGRIYNDTTFSFVISENRTKHRVAGPYKWLRPRQSSTRHWRDTDAILTFPIWPWRWIFVHDYLGVYTVSALMHIRVNRPA